MIEMSDPLGRLRAANPVPAAEVALLRPDPVLFDRITSVPPARVAAPSRRPWRGRRLLPALVATSLLGGAVAYAVLRKDVTRPETVACYETADLDASAEIISVGAGGPVETCAELWRRGALEGRTDAPPLVACVLDTGVAGVFPAAAGVDVCRMLDLTPIAPTPPPPTTTTFLGPGPAPPLAPAADLNTRIVAFRDAVVPQFLDAQCMAPATGVDIVRRELDRAGLGDWTVASTGFTTERPCATLSLRTEERTVILVPAPPRPR
jgi:hypothetical protein